MAQNKPQPKKAKVGDEVELGESWLVGLPDGSVVTARQRYRFAHAGRHVVGGVEYEVSE